MTRSTNDPLQIMASATPFGERIVRVMAIARDPKSYGASSEMHAQACTISKAYKDATQLSKWRKLTKLWGLFNTTEKFFKDFPGVDPAV